MLAETRRQCQEQFARSLRAHEWAQCWLLSPWRQQAAFVLAVSTAQLVDAVARQRPGGQLLRYVPELYIGAMLDMVRRMGGGQGEGGRAGKLHGRGRAASACGHTQQAPTPPPCIRRPPARCTWCTAASRRCLGTPPCCAWAWATSWTWWWHTWTTRG